MTWWRRTKPAHKPQAGEPQGSTLEERVRDLV